MVSFLFYILKGEENLKDEIFPMRGGIQKDELI